MTSVLLGNAAPLMADGSPADVGNTITQVSLREGWDDKDEIKLALSTGNDLETNLVAKVLGDKANKYLFGVLEINQLWVQAHSADPPEWVESEDSGLASALAEFFSSPGHEVTTKRPDGWDESMSDQVRAAMGMDARPPIGGGSYETNFTPEEFSYDFWTRWREHELLVNAGRDALHRQHLDTAAQPASFNYMCVSANATAPSAANTSCPGEITTAGGGLLRAQATFAHTNGTNTSTLTKTFTGNGSDSYPVTIAKIGVLNASSAGTLGYETLLNATATLTISGDNVAITHTITAG